MNIRLICAFLLFASCAESSYAQIPKGRIVFSSRLNDTGYSELYVINSDGTAERRITNLNNRRKDLPSVYHNRIVYRQVEDKKSQRASILIKGIDRSQPKTIIEKEIVCNPKWSCDGKLIAYEYYPDNGGQEIWVTDTNGNNRRKLISNARHPCWSYDNKLMLFTRDYAVWAYDLKQGTEKKLTNRDTLALFPAISPNGKQFAYHGEFKDRFGIFVADMNNGKVRKFISICGDMFFWTDDPKFLVSSCLNKATDQYDIALINIETGEKTYITNNKRGNYTPAWLSE